MTRKSLTGKVAIVAGASRGCGKGIALALGEQGATVYVAARTTRSGAAPVDNAPGDIDEVADQVTSRGGRGIATLVDFTDAGQVKALFERIANENQRLDIAVCAVWGGNERGLDPAWTNPFWKQQPTQSWCEFIDAGPRAFWLLAHGACGIMASQPPTGLIVGISEPILENAFEGQQSSVQETFSHLSHYGINRLVADLSGEARRAGIAVVGLLPGFMRTERVQMHLEVLGEGVREQFRYDLAESPEYSGRAVAALAADPQVLDRAGKLLYVGDLAGEYGFTDIDGKQVANFYRILGLIK